MRVITGTARGRKLKLPKGMDIRPTTDMVKESVFNIIQDRVPESRMLDLFAGTGQMGIEALSRGAREVVFVDMSPVAIKLVKENLTLSGLSDRGKVIRGDSLTYLKRGEKFDIVFIDPPYETDLLEKALESVAAFDILNKNGIIICECKKEKEIPQPSCWDFVKKEYIYGRIKLTTFVKPGE